MKHQNVFVNLTNRKFGYLTAIEYLGYENGGSYYLCQCDCGERKRVRGGHLVSGKIKSCGCQHGSLVSQSRRRHGRSRTPIYVAWLGMISRCYHLDNHAYSSYGGRGITVCDRWRESFENFLADMGEIPGKHLSVDRINNDGPYSPENCKWSTKQEQAENRRSSIYFTFQGKTQSIAAWSKETGVKYSTLHYRLRYLGWSIDKALTKK